MREKETERERGEGEGERERTMFGWCLSEGVCSSFNKKYQTVFKKKNKKHVTISVEVETVQILLFKDGFGDYVFTFIRYELIHSDTQRKLSAFYLHISLSLSIENKIVSKLEPASSRLNIDAPVDGIGRLLCM